MVTPLVAVFIRGQAVSDMTQPLDPMQVKCCPSYSKFRKLKNNLFCWNPVHIFCSVAEYQRCQGVEVGHGIVVGASDKQVAEINMRTKYTIEYFLIQSRSA